MVVVFLGPPGAGKGTQAKRICEQLSLRHLSSGDILRRERQEGTELGRKAQTYMDAGELVPDDLIVAMMAEHLQGRQGCILDGFPRTLAQARALDAALEAKGQSVGAVVSLEVGAEALVPRLTGRRSCPNCGQMYHVKNMPPQREGICDACGSRLIQRSDDHEATVRQRLVTYLEQTEPLITYYERQGKLLRLDANRDADSVTEELVKVLSARVEGGR